MMTSDFPGGYLNLYLFIYTWSTRLKLLQDSQAADSTSQTATVTEPSFETQKSGNLPTRYFQLYVNKKSKTIIKLSS